MSKDGRADRLDIQDLKQGRWAQYGSGFHIQKANLEPWDSGEKRGVERCLRSKGTGQIQKWGRRSYSDKWKDE